MQTVRACRKQLGMRRHGIRRNDPPEDCHPTASLFFSARARCRSASTCRADRIGTGGGTSPVASFPMRSSTEPRAHKSHCSCATRSAMIRRRCVGGTSPRHLDVPALGPGEKRREHPLKRDLLAGPVHPTLGHPLPERGEQRNLLPHLPRKVLGEPDARIAPRRLPPHRTHRSASRWRWPERARPTPRLSSPALRPSGVAPPHLSRADRRHGLEKPPHRSLASYLAHEPGKPL